MKKEIIVDGKASDWFEKATFTLKDENASDIPKDLFSYAEELVEKHLKRFPAATKRDRPISHKEIEQLQYEKALKEVYQMQTNYRNLKNKEKSLLRKEQRIHCFFVLSVGICLISVIALACSMIFV